MATALPPQDNAASITSAEESDYGSDLDEATVDALFSAPEPDVEKPIILDDHGDSRQPVARLARTRGKLSQAITAPSDAKGAASVEIEYDESNRRTFSPPPVDKLAEQTPIAPVDENDTRSPLLRFRTPPKKPLSVTDLVSPAWCELQYFYSLSRYGRVRRTPAMKQGSSVHKVLEEQVHTEVPVEVVTKEDRFGLRLWNVVQGLRTLRREGMTRELEVWGVLGGEGGEVVNGIIDQITTVCPDEEAEAKMLEEAEGSATTQKEVGGGKKTKPLPPDQRTLGQYFGGSTLESQQSGTLESRHGSAWLGTLHQESETLPVRKLYVVDVKTRRSNSLPAHGSQTRPTYYQLMLYHRLFSRLAANEVPAERVFERYGLDHQATFSDSFLAQMGTLGLGFEDENGAAEEWDGNKGVETQKVDVREGHDDLEILLAHNTLGKLWGFMIQEFARTIPPAPPASVSAPPIGTSTPTPSTISTLLTAEFRSASSGNLIGKRHFPFSAPALDAYVADELSWWRGERATKGVDMEEAFKCGYCEFAEGCEWRAGKVEEGVQKAKLRREEGLTRRKSRV
ncbi:hypothetical protein LTR91_018260 [Friedmanniomyces endolithicus]|uniref:Exonuclease V n=1 Tax=Friedmanniomyces endolithicus TaxID=329885 RepID=A0AAN6K2Z5_9PEZI|nr:hypothetical protein LTR57_016087 [Friedmanniomyces endolithicus]KAK0962859.1 hypothetical protein LTS01_019569 [Friedmanniomyces endolithicus]KAK0964802.1 hypothetical protein LTR91_018260 [Friedmanniomyces endolithicus]KAK1028054.1 hypothetical protein LTS16_020966 [Friedmanniomyces endolithicus]